MFVPTETTNQSVVRPAPGVEPFLLFRDSAKFYHGEQKYLPFQGGCVVVFMGLFAIFALVFLAVTINQAVTADLLRRTGMATQATVTSRRTTHSSKGGTTYYLTYLFNVKKADKNFSREQTVNSDYYYAHGTGARVPILYLESDPNTSMLSASNASNGPITTLLFALLWLAIPLSVLYFTIRSYIRDRELARDGQIILGEVTNSEGHMTSGKNRYFKLTVQYQFRSPSGVMIYGKNDGSRDDLKNGPLPRRGTPVAVLYLNEKRFKML